MTVSALPHPKEAILIAMPFQDGMAAYQRGDYATAMRLWRPLADQGHARAQCNLGVLYEQGLGGLPKDEHEAARLFKLAADRSDTHAQCNLGFMYETGRGVPQDDAAAAIWYRKAADQGHARAQYNLGVMHERGHSVPQDDAAAAIWYRKAADQGDASARCNLGAFYSEGRGGLPKDEHEAARLFMLAADLGNAWAQTNLGVFYEHGRGGLPKDDHEAARLFKLAADQGHARAQCNLGVLYEQGLGGLPKDEHEAARLYKLAADQGDAPAHAALTRLGRRQQQEEQQRQKEAAAPGATGMTTANTTPSALSWSHILETKGSVTQHLTLVWNKLTTTQKISIAVVVSLLFMFRDQVAPSNTSHSLARTESVFVKYRGPVNLKFFDCTDITRSSFISRVCFDRHNEYMIVSLNGTYYHYCDIDDETVDALEAAPSMGRFFNASIKGHFDCRTGHVPAY